MTTPHTITGATVADWHRRARQVATLTTELLADMEATHDYSDDEPWTPEQAATADAVGYIRAAVTPLARAAYDGPSSPFGRIAALVSGGKHRPPNYGTACYGLRVIIDCPAGGQSLPPGTKPAQRAGEWLDPSAAMNPRSHREIGTRKHDAYHCPNPRCTRAYVALTSAGVVQQHRTQVMKHDYENGVFDV